MLKLLLSFYRSFSLCSGTRFPLVGRSISQRPIPASFLQCPKTPPCIAFFEVFEGHELAGRSPFFLQASSSFSEPCLTSRLTLHRHPVLHSKPSRFLCYEMSCRRVIPFFSPPPPPPPKPPPPSLSNPIPQGHSSHKNFCAPSGSFPPKGFAPANSHTQTAKRCFTSSLPWLFFRTSSLQSRLSIFSPQGSFLFIISCFCAIFSPLLSSRSTN